MRLSEGDKCPNFGPNCCGRLRIELDGDCACAVLGSMAPCSACEGSFLICDDCEEQLRGDSK